MAFVQPTIVFLFALLWAEVVTISTRRGALLVPPDETCTQRRPSKLVDSCSHITPGNLAHLVTPEAQEAYERREGGYASAVRAKKCNAKCRSNVPEVPDFVSRKHKFMWHGVSKTASDSVVRALTSCPELELERFTPAKFGQEDLSSYTYLGAVRDPLERFLSGYEQFWANTLRYTNRLSKVNLQTCFNAHSSNRHGPKHCGGVVFHGLGGAKRHLRMDVDAVRNDAEYKMIRNLAFSEFYDYPVDMNSPKVLKAVLKSISLMAHGCNCWKPDGACQVYLGEGNFMPVVQLTMRSFDFAIRAEHVEEDYESFLRSIGVPFGTCPPLQLRNETAGDSKLNMVDESLVRKAIESDEGVRRGICDMYKADALCMGYGASWRNLCDRTSAFHSWGETVAR